MAKISIYSIVFAGFLLTASAGFSDSPVLLVPVPDESGNETGLFNVNPDPDEEPWISGGGRALTEEEEKCIPELVLPEHYRDRETYPLPLKVDNSTTKFYPPIFTQKGASCCQASGVAYIFSYEICRLRDLDAQDPANIFPYGFAYNFINGGSTGTYSGFNDGWTMADELGIPDLEIYGGDLEGTASQTSWSDGYDIYYQAMRNRFQESYRVTCTTNDGIEKMKQWLFDRADGSDPGGVMGFLAWSGQTMGVLPASSPEAGHSYIKAFGTSGGHCMTLVGYNDEISYDLNGDGKFEKRETGGFLMVNTYGTSYGTDGRAYIPYSLFLDGSMKSNSVYGITVKDVVKPLLTYKVKITHDRRDAIEIIRGFSTDLTASSPSTTYRYSDCFSDGGALPMEGKGLSETIEVGLDVSEFIEDISGKKTKFFLQIDSQGGSGVVVSFSVMDYTGGTAKEYTCTQSNVTISNGTTTLWVISDDAVNNSNTPFTRPHDSKLFYASPLTNGNSILFKFSAPETNAAIFRIVTVHGRLVYEKAFAVTNTNNFSWNVRNSSGKRVANGKYIAQLERNNKKGKNKILYTQFYVMK